MSTLPDLSGEHFLSTRDYLRDVTLIIGSLQRAFLPEHPRSWQHGLDINMRGPASQTFVAGGKEYLVLLDLVTHKLRLDGNKWQLDQYGTPELLNNVKFWLKSKGLDVELDEPELSGKGVFDTDSSNAYAEALWWCEKQFRALPGKLKGGVFSPILLYPHHFDLSLVWFPHGDDKQFGLGFSTGDKDIKGAYIYLTAYPEPDGFTQIDLPEGAYWQAQGFSGAILPYSALRASDAPEKLISDFALKTIRAGQMLYS